MNNQKAMANSIKEALTAMEVSAIQLAWFGGDFNKACKTDAWKALSDARKYLEFATNNANQAVWQLEMAEKQLEKARLDYIAAGMEAEDIHESNTY